MENNNQITIQKLENAINTLLNAYEELQEKSKQKDETITNLKETIVMLEEDIANLENNSGKQNSTLGSMLGKIESILDPKKQDNQNEQTNDNTNPTLSFENNKQDNQISTINIDDIIVNPAKIPTKNIDEDRMNKLLGGFN